ncbi:substrate-binding domain-containing protein [Luteolibacter ambystomatis]|uniref:Substrate-binding domain-containing protein n=1 Tax=Luteolibacter ambystomatis TaxID=2824561 RepID=A0A975IZ05_9BACT|nr:substrate-binding domain-containing protein [Luteolibacter ambystomatis]QUE50428.1 substrate-binding domain-containing protein [Luteolibacter ambystomatis]
MQLPRAISISESTAEVIKTGLQTRRWPSLPGERHLATELGVSRATVRNALALLTEMGHLSSPSQGHKRSVRALPVEASRDGLRVDLLIGRDFHFLDQDDRQVLTGLSEAIMKAGHRMAQDFPNLSTIKPTAGGFERFVKDRAADVRIIYGGAWESLRWFAERPEPVLALGGRSLGLNLDSIGIDTSLAVGDAVRTLTRLGHRRIAFICHRYIREAPTPGRILRAFIDALADAGVEASPYNHPAWDESVEGLQEVLEELFRITPPTAIIVGSSLALAGLMSFCNRCGLRIPEHLSLVVLESSLSVQWFRPKLAMIRIAPCAELVSAAMDWLKHPSREGREPLVKLLPSSFLPEASLAPPYVGKLPR